MIAEVDGPHPDDNAHMAAAVAGPAESLVTWNAKDFDCGFIRKQAIKIMDPDEYLCGLYEEFPDEVIATIAKLAASKHRPPMTPVDLVAVLGRASVGEFASLVRTPLTRAAGRRARARGPSH